MIEFRTLGALDLRDAADGRPLHSVLAQPKRAAFLAFLALAGPGRFHRRDTLLGVFWPESGEKQARHSLSQAVYLLRRSLGNDAILTRGEEEIALSAERVRCDAVEFERTLAAGDPAGALDLYHGELLQGFHLADSIEFEKWLSGERLRLEVAAVNAARRLATEAADDADAIRWLRRATEWAPYDEALRRELMTRLARSGDRTGALIEYDALARRMKRDLEMEPSPESTLLATRLRQGEAASPARRAATTLEAPAAAPVDRARARARPPRPLLRRAAMFAPILLLAAAAPVLIRRDATPAASAAAADRVAVLPFDVRGSESLAYLGEGMALLLSAKLDGAGALRGVDPEAVLHWVDAHPGATNGTRGRAVARDFDAGQYVLGTVVEAGGRISVRVGLYDRDGTLRTQAAADAQDEAGIFAVVDDVARTLIASRLGSDADRLSRLAAETTQSLPALKAYLEGERAYRHGRFAEAASAFERAAVGDSTFALAHYRLSLASLWADAPDTLPFDADARALRHAERLSEHDHQLLLAYGAWRGGDANAAERIYRNVLGLYPDDAEAALMLGETLFHYNHARGRAIAEARAPLERVLQLDRDHWGALWHLLLIAGSDRRMDDFRALAARLEQLGPSAQQALELRALVAFAARDEALIRPVLAELRSAHPLQAQDIAWRIAVHLHDPVGAMRVARLGLTPDHDGWYRQNAHLQLAWLNLALGRDAEAAMHLATPAGANGETRVASALAFDLPLRARDHAAMRTLRAMIEAAAPAPQEHAHTGPYADALRALADGDTATALRQASRLAAISPELEPFAAGVRAGVALHGGRSAEAIRLLDRAPLVRWFGWASSSAAQSGTNLRWIRAEALRALGRHEEALDVYAGFAEGGIHDLAWLAPAHLRSAGILERIDRPDEAAEHYRRFIELWAEADADLRPEVERARRRLADLES